MILTIIIPVYNVADYLPQCLDSVFAHELTHCEVICVNDGSTDNSRTILAEYQQQFPELILIDRENGGLSAARNSGLNVAKGEYIYFLDSDDYLLGDSMTLLKQAINKQVDIVSLNSIIDKQGSLYFTNRDKTDATHDGIEYFKCYYNVNGFFPVFPVWMYVYKKSFLDTQQLTFKEGFLHEDIDFTSRAIYLAKSVCQIDKPIQFHRVLREGAISQTIKLKNLEHTKLILIDLYYFYKEKNCTEIIFFQYLFELFLTVMKRVVTNYPEKAFDFFQSDEKHIVKSCVVQKDMFVNYFLFFHFPKLFLYYISNNSNIYVRKTIKNIFRIIHS